MGKVKAREAGRMLTVKEVAALLSVSRQTVYAMMDRGELSYVQMPAFRRIPEGSVQGYLQQRTRGE